MTKTTRRDDKLSLVPAGMVAKELPVQIDLAADHHALKVDPDGFAYDVISELQPCSC